MGLFGGSSKSSSTDARSVADNGAIAVGGKNNVIQMTDGGLIEQGADLWRAADAENTDRLRLIVDAGAKVMDLQKSALAADTDRIMGILDAKKAADTPASSDLAGGLGKTMIYGVVALAAVFVFAGGVK